MKQLFILKKWYLLLLLCLAGFNPIFGQSLTMSPIDACNGIAQLSAPSTASGSWSIVQGAATFANISLSNTSVTTSTGQNVFRWTLSDKSNYGDVTVTYVQTPTANAGIDKTACSLFTLGAANPTTGTGTWSFVSGTGTFVNPTVYNTQVTVDVGGIKTLKWTVTLGTCSASDEVILTSNLAVPVLEKKEITVCPGSYSQLKVSGGDSYTWSAVSQMLTYLSGINSASPTISYATTTSASFIVYATTTTCPNNQVSAEALVHFSSNAVKADAGDDINYCSGSTGFVTLQATGKGTFEWSPSAEMTNPESATPSVQPTVTTTYTLKFTDIYGCTATDAVTVSVTNGIPSTASITASKTEICQGETVNLVATGGTNYKWAANPSLSATNIANPTATLDESDTFYLTVTNNLGCSDSQEIRIYVNPYFDLLKNSDVSSAGGNDGSLYVAVETQNYSVLWSTGETTTSISSLVAGHYTATVTGAGCELTKDIEVFEPLVNSCNLTADFTTEIVDNTIYVYNQTEGGSKFTWDFGDGTLDYSTTVATHTYASEDTYEVCLTAYNSNSCISKLCKTVSIGTTTCNAEIGFTVNPNNAKEIRFVGNTSKNIKKWYWEFGDGTTSDVQNPVHTYTNENFYSVAFRVKTTISGCVANAAKEINVGKNNLRASFVTFVDVTSSIASVSFSDMSLGDVVSWFWYFGDGSISTVRNPIHLYPVNKNYIATLTVSNKNGNISTYSLPIQTGTNQVIADYDFSVDPSTKIITFTNKSVGIGTWSPCLWVFDDGGISILDSPSHIYAKAGLYKVTLVVGNASYTKFDRITKEIQIGDINCSAKFAAFVNPDTRIVKFTNIGVGSNLSYNWEFGDNTILDEANPTHSYNNESFYTVRLKVRSNDNTCMDAYETTILVGNKERYNKSDFTFRINDKAVKFMNLTQGNTSSYTWNFGDDSNISTEEMPYHTFTKYGIFNVCLTVKTTTSSHMNCKEVRIVPEGTALNYVQSGFDQVINISTKTVNFFDKSKGTADKWEWNFGDNQTSLLQSPTHAYTTAGYYLVSLSATNSTLGLKSTSYKLINVGANNGLAIKFAYQTLSTSKKAGGYPLDLTGAAFGDPAKMVWDFGDGNVEETTTTPNHVYTTPGTYHVCVTATDPTTSQTATTCEDIVVTTSDVEVLKAEDNLFALKVAPNPANDFVTISYNVSQTTNVKLTLFDVSGKELVTLQNAKIEKGSQEFKFDVSQLTQGVYYIHLQSDKEVTTKKLIINR